MPAFLPTHQRPLERGDYVAAAEREGLDPDAFEAIAQADVLAGQLEFPRSAQIQADSSGLAVTPPAYWGWLINLLSYVSHTESSKHTWRS